MLADVAQLGFDGRRDLFVIGFHGHGRLFEVPHGVYLLVIQSGG
jgi:hypothetical protein